LPEEGEAVEGGEGEFTEGVGGEILSAPEVVPGAGGVGSEAEGAAGAFTDVGGEHAD